MRRDEGLPWPQLMEIAFGMLGMSPREFWSMTPPEWLAAWRGLRKKYGMPEMPPDINRSEVEEMIRRFPD